jgi:hypothetical protein
LLEEGVVELVGLRRSVVGEIRQVQDEAGAKASPSGRSVNSSIQLALTRASGLSEVDGRQDTDQ